MQYPNADMYNQEEPEYQRGHFQPQDTFTDLAVTECVLIPTGEYNKQYQRPWVTNDSPQNRNEIANVIAQSYHNHQSDIRNGKAPGDTIFTMAPELLAGTASNFLMPSVKTEAEILLPRYDGNSIVGWGDQRCRFILTVVGTRLGVKTVFVYVGVTDRQGTTATGQIDPRMNFTINAVYEQGVAHEMATGGSSVRERYYMANASQVLSNHQFNGSIEQHQQHRLRPVDVIGHINISHINDVRGDNALDLRSASTSTPMKSRFGNTNPNSYLSSIIGGLTAGQHMAEQTNRPNKKWELAASYVGENKAPRDPLIRAMSQMQASSMTDHFTWGDMLQMFPGVDNDAITKVHWRDRIQHIGAAPGEDFHSPNQSHGWHGGSRTTIVATQIANTIPDLMVNMLIRSISIVASNRVGGQPHASYSRLVPFIKGMDMVQNAELFKMQFLQQLVRDISFDNQIAFDISVTANMLGDIWISLNLEGHEPADYIMPAYANSLLSPVTSRNRGNLDQLASDFDTLQREAAPSLYSNVRAENNVWSSPNSYGNAAPNFATSSSDIKY